MNEIKKILNHNVLVLNKSWIPIHITTVRDAVGLIYVGAAKVVIPNTMIDINGIPAVQEFENLEYDKWCEVSERLDSETIDILKSGNRKHFKPSVIVLTRYNGKIRYEIRFCRASLYERDKGMCQYCGKSLTKSESTVDHVKPKSKGGTNSWNNVVLSCKPCNARKDSFSLEEAKIKLLTSPGKPSWVSVKFGKARNIKERNEWAKFTNAIDIGIEL